jgi:hypothetical protein
MFKEKNPTYTYIKKKYPLKWIKLTVLDYKGQELNFLPLDPQKEDIKGGSGMVGFLFSVVRVYVW